MEIQRVRIPPQSGAGFQLSKGQTLRITSPEAEQVCDLIAFGLDRTEWLSTGRSIDYNETIYLTTGNILYSNRSNPMLTIGRDDCGRHDVLFAPCSPEMFQKLYDFGPDHPSCFRNLADNLAPLGIRDDQIPTTFNVFMNAELLPDGRIKVIPPLNKAGDVIELTAEMDLIVGLTACSAELSNNWSFKPIDYEIV
ncbi:MAG: DUF1989 domain-containing protein [Dehalococcoidia bacterium]